MNAPAGPCRVTIALVVTARSTAVNFLLGFARHLASEGCKVFVIADDVSGLGELAMNENIEFVAVPMSREPSPLRDLRSLLRMCKTIRTIRPDVLAYATPKASLLAAIAGFAARVPVRIYELWGLRLETTRYPLRMVLAICEGLTSLASTVVLANSASLQRRFTQLRLNCGRSVAVLGAGSSHGVDTERYSSGARYPSLDRESRHFVGDQEDFIAGFVGRLHPDKGIGTLLRALQIGTSQGLKLRTLIVGNCEGFSVEASLLNMQRPPVVLITGAKDDPRPYFAAMDVLVLPSRREGFPNVVLEAAAMGVPAIVSNATGVTDSVVDGLTGYVVPVDDSEALAAAIMRMQRDPRARMMMGLRARERAVALFRQEEVWQRHEAFMRSELGATDRSIGARAVTRRAGEQPRQSQADARGGTGGVSQSCGCKE